MRSSTIAHMLMRAALAVGALFAVGVLLANIPAHRGPGQPQEPKPQEPTPQASADATKDDMAGMHDHDQMSQKDSLDEKKNEGNAVHDMMHGHHHGNGPHMRMTQPRSRTKSDDYRVAELIAELHRALEKYKDYRAADADGYKIFLPNVPQPEYHFTNYWNGFLEAMSFDPARPTSLLYKKTSAGFELAGAMYTMPRTASEDQLNACVPLSVTPWHLHTNLCMPPQNLGRHADWTKFGLRGSIHTQKACDAVGGRFQPVIFGWMVHVYPFEDTQEKIFGQ